MTVDAHENNESVKPEGTRRSEAILIVGLAALSFALGFFIVHMALPRNPAAAPAADCKEPAESQPIEIANFPTAQEDTDAAPEDGESLADQGSALPEVPPGPTPDGLRIDGVPLYFKCWNTPEDTTRECDRLRVLEKRMNTRLYVVHECAKEYSDLKPGILSLGANLDYGDNSIKFWSGPSSTIANHDKVGNCLRTKLAGLPIYGIDHKYYGYRIFFTVEFFDPEQRAREIARKRNTGREVQVTMDRVNVREEPVDGPSLGRISSDSKVVFLKKNETKDWCYVITPSNREGWMICDALKL